MTKTIYIPVTVFLLLMANVQPAQAQVDDATKYGQAGMSFLAIEPSARVAAMGGTYAGVTGSSESIFTNQAGLALLEGFDGMASVTNWIADTKLLSLSAAYRLGNIGSFGVSFISMDYGELRRTIPYNGTDPELRNQGYIDQGTFSPTELAIGLAYARQITNQFFVGGQIRYANQDLGSVDIIDEFTGEVLQNHENSLSNIVFDIGTLYYTGFRDLRLSVNVRNFSNQADYFNQRFELPLTLDFGMAMDLLQLTPSEPGVTRNSTLMLAADWQHPRDAEERLHVGAEYGLMDMFFIRGGYMFNYDSEGLTAGVGVRLDAGGIGLKADYAYVDSNEFFGQIHRVALGIFMR